MIKYKAGYKYQLAKDYLIPTGIKGYEADTKYIKHSSDGIMLIISGYSWDGASGPAIDTKNFIRGSLVHDSLYELMRLGLLPTGARKQADLLLKKICLEDGMSKIRAAWVYWAVQRFAKRSAMPENRKPIQTAP